MIMKTRTRIEPRTVASCGVAIANGVVKPLGCCGAAVVLVCVLLGTVVGCGDASPARPVIGVLTVPVDNGCETIAGPVGTGSPKIQALKDRGAVSCFSAFYVQWIESGGAQVAVIPFDAAPEKVDAILASVDGVLFTGGGLSLELNTTYDQTANHIFNYAKSHRITLWGTCMGFQLLNVLAAQDRAVLDRYSFDSENISWPLNFTPEAKTSKLFKSATSDVFNILKTENVTMNFHHDGVTPATYKKTPALSTFYDILSTNLDRNGKEFVSTIEASDKSLSIYGVQWHPERPQFEWTPSAQINHSGDSVEANSWVARFFINSARLTLPSAPVQQDWFIYNHTLMDPMDDSYMWYLFGSDGISF